VANGPSDIVANLAPTGTLRAAINLGNPVLAAGTACEPTGVTVDLARELASRLGVPSHSSASTRHASPSTRS
jgi:polar amino acid transport system substrate-binding protein